MHKSRFLCLLLTLVSCQVASAETPDFFVKPVTKFNSPAAKQAAGYFWNIFQIGDYANVDHALHLLQSAHEADPNDVRLAELTGLCGFWKVAEHGRIGLPSQATAPLAIHSLNILSNAQALDPHNVLTPAFTSTAKFELGAIQRNQPLMTQAMRELQRNTDLYPKFHGFVEGWVLTAMLHPDHPCYDGAVDAYFATLDSCAGIRVPRIFPKVGPIGLALVAKQAKNATECYNSNYAPHNLEGTLLGLGDALLKRGDLREAKIVYKSIPNIGNYKHWPYKHVLNHRLANLKTLQRKFVVDSGCTDVREPAMLYQSCISCAACHATNSPTIRYDMGSCNSKSTDHYSIISEIGSEGY